MRASDSPRTSANSSPSRPGVCQSHIRPLNPLPDHMWKEFNPFYVMSLPPILEYHAATYEPHEDD